MICDAKYNAVNFEETQRQSPRRGVPQNSAKMEVWVYYGVLFFDVNS